jgi:hypothetical protein
VPGDRSLHIAEVHLVAEPGAVFGDGRLQLSQPPHAAAQGVQRDGRHPGPLFLSDGPLQLKGPAEVGQPLLGGPALALQAHRLLGRRQLLPVSVKLRLNLRQSGPGRRQRLLVRSQRRQRGLAPRHLLLQPGHLGGGVAQRRRRCVIRPGQGQHGALQLARPALQIAVGGAHRRHQAVPQGSLVAGQVGQLTLTDRRRGTVESQAG